MRLPFLLISICLLYGAQTKVPPAQADYRQWETLVSGSRFGGGPSPDGRWLAYGIDRSNGTDELRIVKDGQILVVGIAKWGSTIWEDL